MSPSFIKCDTMDTEGKLLDWKNPTAVIVSGCLAFELFHGEALKPHVEVDVKPPNNAVLRYTAGVTVTSGDPVMTSLPPYWEIDLK